ncbi:P-loop NTPase [candidate division KSB1 bacterium]|nr:P-loop NTPase [candidate division KSB1 bacterium]NIR72663.1 P-loop NTPase [candidate division KSB1 bacterium]NIS23693.1 P-loop NTPase [candidate division KSB1 bacterium]NIT70613.1 P-loop NTPase [candidate division KSB1 bacterium]NIU24341.1 P-loop NTPase [candidate division KSB1 bacterium]
MEDLLIKVDQNTIGPLSLKKLEKLVKQGTFSPLDLVWDGNKDRWIPAQNLAELQPLFASSNGHNGAYQNKIYAVASGKGGVGKTVTTASLGVGLASIGSEVILVDADFGGANLHTCMGILKPEYNFDDFYNNSRKPLTEFILDTPVKNLRMISGTSGSMSLANPKYHQKQRLIRGLKKLQADHIIMDLGAGSDYNVIDLFLLADEHILVVSTEPAAILEAFGFIRVCLLRALKRAFKEHKQVVEIIEAEESNRPGRVRITIDKLLDKISEAAPEARFKAVSLMNAFEPKIILNKVRRKENVNEGRAIQHAIWDLLSLRSDYLGYISYDPNVSRAVKNFKPFLVFEQKTPASQDILALIQVKILGKKGIKELFAKRKWQKKLSNISIIYPDAQPSKDAPICSDVCFYWGNCEYQNEGHPCPVRHLESILSN